MEEIRSRQLKSQERGPDIPIVVLKLELACERIDKHGDSQPSSRECEAGVEQGLSPVGGPQTTLGAILPGLLVAET